MVLRIPRISSEEWLVWVGDGLSEEDELVRIRSLWGGSKPNKYVTYELYLNSKYWKRIRELVLRRDDYSCQLCGSRASIQVHHKKSPLKYGLGEEVFSNLQTLCYVCHSEHTTRFDLRADYYFEDRRLVSSSFGQAFEILRRRCDGK